ncbi:protein PAT1 homolog 2 [Pholidichthys leucotaenia]
MNHLEQQQSTEACELQWPENGEDWSDLEDGVDTDGGFLQAMAEEDEEINVYNEETFGMDLNTNGTTDDACCSLAFGEPLPSAPPQTPPPECKPPSPQKVLSTPPQKQQYVPQVASWKWSRGRRQRGRLSRGLMFDDPAVMRTVEGKPSLKSLDNAIVECGMAIYQRSFEDDRMMPSYRKRGRGRGSILEDSAIVCVIGQRGRGQQLNSNFLDFPSAISSFGIRRGEPRGSYHRKQFGQRGPSRMHAPIVPRSPILSRQPLTPRQHYNQVYSVIRQTFADTGGFMFPPNQACPSTPQPLTPKISQLRFGANSPRPSPFDSPSSYPVQPFRYPDPVTQLHPQHKRLLGQKQCVFQRKSDSWDPYSNLMTAKEKEWIIRLQMIQLQSENPYLDDYYYQEYYRQMEAKMAKEELGIKSKRAPPKLSTPYITKTESYTPVVHIEGSLGQVTVSTCHSPRRAISAVHAVQPHGQLEEQKDTRQQRLEILSKIEKLFMILLEVEEMEQMTSVLSKPEERRLETQRKVELIYFQLQHNKPQESEGEFLPFLLISKGKKLLARLLPYLKHDCGLKVLHSVASHLPTLMSRDADEALPVLYPPLCNVIGGLTFSQLIGVLKVLMTSESLMTSECLTLACHNKFGLSLLYALLSQGEKLLSSGVPLEPSIGDFETWTEMIFQVAGQLSQCSLVEPLLLPSNLLSLFCRYLDKRTLHQLKSNME